MRASGFEAFGRAIRDSVLYPVKDRAPPACFVQAARLMGEGVPLLADDPMQTLETLERRKNDPARFRLPSRVLTRAELAAAYKMAYPGSNLPPVLTTPTPPPSR
jgi:hypothetical protein